MKKIISILVYILLAKSFTSCERFSNTPDEKEEENSPPEILYIVADKSTIYGGETITLQCHAVDIDDNQLTYEWTAGGAGIFYSNGTSITTWEAPETDHDFLITLTVFVRDEEETVTDHLEITVLANEPEEPSEPEFSYYIKYVCDDAYVNEEYPDENYGDELNLFTGPGYYTYLRFDVYDIFDYIDRYNLNSIEKVEIRMEKGFNNTAQKPIGTTEVYGIPWNDNLWFESLINYNHRPQPEDKIAEAHNLTFEVSGGVIFDVKEDFLNKVQVIEYYSVMISTPEPDINSACFFYSKELNNLHPEYEDAATPVLWIKYKTN